MTIDERNSAMQSMRAYAPDSAIAEAFGLTRQRVHALLGPRARRPAAAIPLPPEEADAADRLPAELRQWRARRGLSQAQAAEALGIEHGTLNRWETGRGGCSLAGLVLHYLRLRDEKELTRKGR